MTDEKEIIYEPVAGLTIKEALARSILLSKQKNKSVKAIINDIIMDITAETNLKEALNEYHLRLDELYTKKCKKERN